MDKLLIQKEMDKYNEKMLKTLDRFVDSNGVKKALGDRSIGRTQLNGLLNSCRQASSVEEIKLLISYKKAKEKRNKGWHLFCGGKAIADKLIESIEEIESIAMDICKETGKKDTRSVKLMVVEKYLGYLYWKGTVVAEK